MVTRNQKPVTDIQKINRKEYKPNTKESHQIRGEENTKGRNREELQKQPENNEQNGNK